MEIIGFVTIRCIESTTIFQIVKQIVYNACKECKSIAFLRPQVQGYFILCYRKLGVHLGSANCYHKSNKGKQCNCTAYY